MVSSPETNPEYTSDFDPSLSVTEQLFRIALVGSSIQTSEGKALAQIIEAEVLLHEAEEYRH